MKDKSCKVCGYTLSRFYATGLLGCPACYRSFNTEVAAAVKDAQDGNAFHLGKSPYGENKTLINRYKSLLAEKERAVIERRFDDISAYSDEIVKLSEELKSRGIVIG